MFNEFVKLRKRIQNEKNNTIFKIRSDHGGEFENELYAKYCNEYGIFHEFSFPRAPSKNGVVEHKNRTL